MLIIQFAVIIFLRLCQAEAFDLTPNEASHQIIITPANFEMPYKSNVSAKSEILYRFSYSEKLNMTSAFRVHVAAETANAEYPVLFDVRQQRQVISWQVPILLSNIFPYKIVSRTLCPLEPEHRTLHPLPQSLYVDVSSSSVNLTTFSLLVSRVLDFHIKIKEKRQLTLSPSEPKFYQFDFPEDVNSVEIRIESDSPECMVVSLQDVKCPVFDLDRNIEFAGSYETITRKGAFTVQKRDYVNEALFIVLMVKSSDYDCRGIEKLIVPVKGEDPREKNVTIHIGPTISDKSYMIAVFGSLVWFLVFWLTAIAIIFLHRSSDTPAHFMGSEPMDSCAASSANSPINQVISESSSYGAINSSGVISPEGQGIPHRIAPKIDSDGSEIDESEIDMLHDAEHDKDIFRAKIFLFVSDLSRKSRSITKKKYKLYSWNLLAIAIFYCLPVVQLVVTYQWMLRETGNQDLCYYNFFCARPLGILSAFNNVFSNIGYVMLGLLFLFIVYRRDAHYCKFVYCNSRLDKYYGVPQHFGLFYALGIALVMEGVLSGCYHVCPSYTNFQFDTSFMYMIAWLLMLKIYQTRHPDINPTAHVAYVAISLLVFLAVVGVVSGTVTFWAVYAVLHILMSIYLSMQIYYMGRWRIDAGLCQRLRLYCITDIIRCSRPIYQDRMILLIIGNIINWSLAIYGCLQRPTDFASYLLAIMILNLLMYYAFYIIMKLRSGERIVPAVIALILLASVCWFSSFYFFLSNRTSWKVMPALSREKNSDCILLSFYDEHDIWHFLSSMSLFFSFLTLLFLDDDLVYMPRDCIPVF